MGSNIGKRRRISDLYVKGAEVRFNATGFQVLEDGNQIEGIVGFESSDDDVKLWLQPPNPLQRDQASRIAQAHRAKVVLSAKKDEDSDEGATIRANVVELEKEEVVRFLVMAKESELYREAAREVGGREEWEDLQELQDAITEWEEAGSPDTDEWRGLIERDLEYGRQVNEAKDSLKETQTESLMMLSREELNRRAVAKRIEQMGQQEFLSHYELQMLYFGCRDFDKRDELFFESANDLAEEDGPVREVLTEVLAVFISEAGEAKNWQRAGDGSTSSAPPSEPETSEVSTPLVPTK